MLSGILKRISTLNGGIATKHMLNECIYDMFHINSLNYDLAKACEDTNNNKRVDIILLCIIYTFYTVFL